ncbi:hypothetical protein HBB16_02445 [Pseudonocardia sp. MCCB 268]|nr:hypothetical protein [Pseudonocardia cytotoxica]
MEPVKSRGARVHRDDPRRGAGQRCELFIGAEYRGACWTRSRRPRG